MTPGVAAVQSGRTLLVDDPGIPEGNPPTEDVLAHRTESLVDEAIMLELFQVGGIVLLGDLVALYDDDLRELRAQLDRALTRQDLPAVQKAAHTIRGSSANMGATQLAATARALEQVAAEGDIDGATALSADITRHARQTLEAFAAEIRRLSTPTHISATPC